MRNLLSLKREIKKRIDYTAIKDIRHLFRLKKENEKIKERIIKDIMIFLEKEEVNYYKPVRVGNLWSNNYIERESNEDRNQALLIEEDLNKIRPHLKDIIDDL